MRIDVFTIFPEYFDSPLSSSLLGLARESDLVEVCLHNPRDYTNDKHRSVDDSSFGGGAGMVMMPEPLFDAVEAVSPHRPLLLLSAGGRRLDDRFVRELAGNEGFSLICGRYEGVDHRVADHLCDGEVSVGDYVLAGGEAAALTVIEAVVRLVPGVMGNEFSGVEESFADGLLEYPQYTRPANFRGWEVPEILRSGDHGRITRWRRAQALHRTKAARPDLLVGRVPTPEDLAALEEFPG